jgi:hypothetical protein
MDLNAKITEMKLEEIRVYLSSLPPKEEEDTRQSALNLVVESFYSRYFNEIKKANYGNE